MRRWHSEWGRSERDGRELWAVGIKRKGPSRLMPATFSAAYHSLFDKHNTHHSLCFPPSPSSFISLCLSGGPFHFVCLPTSLSFSFFFLIARIHRTLLSYVHVSSSPTLKTPPLPPTPLLIHTNPLPY